MTLASATHGFEAGAILDQELLVRLGVFALVLSLLALGEIMAPRRRLAGHKPVRWASNLGLVALNTFAARLVFPLGAVGLAMVAEGNGWGLFNNLDLPAWLAVVLAVIVLDFAIYLQHVLFHAVPLLWRLHMVHHADLDVDVTTGLRFHTAEIVVSLGIKLGVVALLGAPALSVLVFEILLNATSMFNHANVRLPRPVERVLRWLLVTPDMHRVHHSVLADETNSNFGFNLPWWDFLLGTYRPEPAQGHEQMTLGLAQLRDVRVAERLPAMLALPFVGPSGNDPINRGEQEASNEDSASRGRRRELAVIHKQHTSPSP